MELERIEMELERIEMELERKAVAVATTTTTTTTKEAYDDDDDVVDNSEIFKKRFDGEINYQVKKTIFRKKKELYKFMKETKAYLSGSFALAIHSILRIHDTPNDMDFFIEIKDEEEIFLILGKAISNIYSLTISPVVTIKRSQDKYDSWSKKIIVYEIKVGGCKIDLVFIFEKIDTILESIDFNMLKNYIKVDEENEDTFIYTSKNFIDILNFEINISHKYIQYINTSLKNYENPESLYYSVKGKLKQRLKKYYKRGYRIAKVGLVETEEDCCCCLEKMKEMNSLFMCSHSLICKRCIFSLKKEQCPLCRAEKAEYSFHRMWEEILFREETFLISSRRETN
jgi:hypothetical protein